MTETLSLPIQSVQRLDSLQPRTALTTVKVQEYAELLRDGIELDPVDVFRVESRGNLLAHGYHRYESRQRCMGDCAATVTRLTASREST